MTRLWPVGIPISVTVVPRADSKDAGIADGQRPAGFTWQNQTHQVDEITRAWRVDIDWWRGRVWRAYFKLSTDTGLLVVIFQDLLSGEWYLQRLYD
ncbi:MAG TPA: DUF6504 family protein [Anaerolineae bacterium]|nr:DUF6504 family protein [Anaerolineae bacterium]